MTDYREVWELLLESFPMPGKKSRSMDDVMRSRNSVAGDLRAIEQRASELSPEEQARFQERSSQYMQDRVDQVKRLARKLIVAFLKNPSGRAERRWLTDEDDPSRPAPAALDLAGGPEIAPNEVCDRLGIAPDSTWEEVVRTLRH